MHMVVTGAAGFIGSHLCERLLADGRQVTGIDAFTRFYARPAKEANLAGLRDAPGFRMIERNLLTGRLAADLEGAGAVCHLAGRPGVRGGAEAIFEAGNVQTTAAVLRAASGAGVRRVVLGSSSSIYGTAQGPVVEDAQPRPLSPYGRSKLRAERLAERVAANLGIELVILRYFTVYGPRQRPDMAFARFIASALAGEPMPLLGDGRQRRDFTYVGDACHATALALDRGRPGATYNVSGGRSAPLSEAFGHLAAALGRPVELQRAARDCREPRCTEADLRRTAAELGWAPSVELDEGIERQVARARVGLAEAACGS